MPVYIGCDFHPHKQTVAWCDTRNGEIRIQNFEHADRGRIEKFYQQFKGRRVIVGVEASGAMTWFEELVTEAGHQFQVGDPAKIRKMAPSRHKTDRRDAEHSLDLLMTGRFPTLWRRPRASEEVLIELRYRQGLVKQRTFICNRLQAIAREAGLGRFIMQTDKGRKLLKEAKLWPGTEIIKENWLTLLDQLGEQIAKVEKELDRRAKADKEASRLMTHPGIGSLTSLCFAHTVGDANRFRTTRQVTAYVGLDPVEASSGDKRRIGSISKGGSKLLRFLLVQAAQVAIKKDEKLRSFYQQVSRRRGTAIAKVATARKLCERAYIMLRDQIDYEEFCRRGNEVGLHVQPRRLASGEKATSNA
jgi:transposase